MTGGCSKKHQERQEETAASKKVSEGELDQIVDRLYKSQTKSSSGSAGKQAEAVDIISKKSVSDGRYSFYKKNLHK